MDYSKLQNTTFDRYSGGITCHKILSVTKKPTGGSTLIVAAPPRLSRGRVKVEVSSQDFEVGEFIDLHLEYTSYSGQVTSYLSQFVGKTPDLFVPKDPTVTWA